jgi:ribosome assembly protein YihI (activator of Der GTPase)
MEALLEKEGTVESWNDERLDELARRMDAGFKDMREGFARIDAKFDQVDAKFDSKFDGLNARIDKLFYIQILFLISLAGALITHSA